MKPIQAKFMGVEDAEKYSGISRWTWRRKAYAREVASTKVGKRLLIPVQDIDRILAEGYRPAMADAQRGQANDR